MGFNLGGEEFSDIRVGDDYIQAIKFDGEDIWVRPDDIIDDGGDDL